MREEKWIVSEGILAQIGRVQKLSERTKNWKNYLIFATNWGFNCVQYQNPVFRLR